MQNRPYRKSYNSKFKKRPFSHKRPKFSNSKINVSKFVQTSKCALEEDPYIPNHKFVDFKIEESLKKNIVKKGYQDPTPIQDKVIPLILEGKDVVGIANTGTGKTAAFLIPIINKVILQKSKVMIIVPTRELALQIEKELNDFTHGLRIFSAVCIGGTSMGKQFSDLRRIHSFVIGTPGRIKDLTQRKSINMSTFNTIILDEADRMLDMGFIEDIKYLINLMPEKKQALCFSATIPSEIEQLIKRFLKEPIKISVKTQESSANVNQDVVRIGREDKLDILCRLLSKDSFHKVLVFGKTKHGVEKLSKELVKKGFKAESIHGNKTQAKRQKSLSLFKRNQINILVATDVAARGLDIDDISHVINYDIPATYDDYVHRIGRTGRGKKKGEAITFIQ
ncbi:MAG: hypothetical protein MCSN_1420 [Candidatus Microsyncoccus archaeolyticus]|nr:MAG: hypothetical protein MCSN_1420 [Candidatus Parcubacteria bacterium]